MLRNCFCLEHTSHKRAGTCNFWQQKQTNNPPAKPIIINGRNAKPSIIFKSTNWRMLRRGEWGFSREFANLLLDVFWHATFLRAIFIINRNIFGCHSIQDTVCGLSYNVYSHKNTCSSEDSSQRKRVQPGPLLCYFLKKINCLCVSIRVSKVLNDCFSGGILCQKAHTTGRFDHFSEKLV